MLIVIILFICVAQGHSHGDHYTIKHITTPILRE